MIAQAVDSIVSRNASPFGGSSVNRLTRSFIVLSAGLFLSLLTFGQQPAKTPPKSDTMEEAHRGIFAPPPNTAVEAVKRSNAVAASLPASSAAMAKIPRKNLIDNEIFGRIERDKIPHAGLSTDAEFIRRAYLDASGQ